MATKFGPSILRAQYPIRIKGNSRCFSHKDNDVVLLCQTCHILICISCSISSHKSHSFIEISKIKGQQINILQDFVKETDNVKIPKLNKELVAARKELSSYQPKYKRLCDNIKEHKDQCKLELDKITTDNIGICQTHITNLEERLVTLVKLSSECKQTLQADTAVLLYDTVLEIQETDLDIPQKPSIDTTEYNPGKDRESNIKQAMGEMKTPTGILHVGSATCGHSNQDPVVRPKLSKPTATGQSASGAVVYKLSDSPSVLSQFSFPDDVLSICPTPDGCAWLCDFDTETVKLINNKGQIIQKIPHTSNITDISLDPTTGRLWFCCSGKKTIHKVSTASTPVTMFTTEGDPFSLCVTRKGRVVVGTGGRQGYNVVVYTADGRVLHTATVEVSGAGFVCSITQCAVTGNIAVVSRKRLAGDSTERHNYRHQIIVYNPTLLPLVHYQGEGIQAQKAFTPDTFYPVTVVYDSKGNIVIADVKRNTIELISGAGQHIKTLHTNKGPQGPVGMQKDDVLWSYLKLGKWELKLLKYYSD